MAAILQMTRSLLERPVVPSVAGIELRHYEGPQDVETWLDIRRRAFARQKLGVGNWDASDFEREFVQKHWWRPEAMWFAQTRTRLLPSSAVGSVTLGRRGDGPDAKGVVHWLAVLPAYRRQGVGRLLVATLEAAIWDSGGRQVWLETHSAWGEAARLYEALGYHIVEE
jgi:ribosomal protein S18 acetylase RimI-like enzyme